MKKQTKPEGKRQKAADNLLKSVGKWVDACGGRAMVAGGIGIMPPGPFGPKYNFSVVIRVTGHMPPKEPVNAK